MEFEPNKRTHRRRTLEQIQKEMKGFDHDLIMSVYHRINGRIEEADTYAEAYFTAQAEMQDGLRKIASESIQDGYEEKDAS